MTKAENKTFIFLRCYFDAHHRVAAAHLFTVSRHLLIHRRRGRMTKLLSARPKETWKLPTPQVELYDGSSERGSLGVTGLVTPVRPASAVRTRWLFQIFLVSCFANLDIRVLSAGFVAQEEDPVALRCSPWWDPGRRRYFEKKKSKKLKKRLAVSLRFSDRNCQLKWDDSLVSETDHDGEEVLLFGVSAFQFRFSPSCFPRKKQTDLAKLFRLL